MIHWRTCNLCEAMCGLEITVEEGRITDVRGDAEDVLSRGHICPKGPALREVYEDPDRVREPLCRTASGWQRVSWDEALAETADKLAAIRSRHGKDAVGVYVGNPTVHNHGAAMLVPAFLRALGTRNRFDANSQDANPKLFAALQVYGDSFALTVPDVDRTDHLLVFGANPAASNGSLMSLGDVKGRLAAIRERGGKIVLIDPRRTESAAWADEHHFIRPGADAALLCALLATLFEERRIDEARVGGGARGLAALRALVMRYPAERVAPSVGIDAETIRRLARDFASAPRAAAYGRVGVCQNEFGGVASWLLEALNVVTGNFDRAGGMMFPRPAVDLAGTARKLVGNGWNRWRSRVRGLPELGGQLPAATMAEEMETEGEGQIRALVVIAGNPVLSVPNGPRLAAALPKLEFLVAVDYYVNETSRHAHLILPPLHALERSHYDVVLHGLAVRNTAKWSAPVMPSLAGGKADWEILYELAMRLGGVRFGNRLLDGAARLAWRLAGVRLSPDRAIDLLLRIGPYKLSVAKLERAPHGIDLGPLTPDRARRVRTSDGRVDLAPSLLVEDAARLDGWLAAPTPDLVLIGRRHVRSNNSWMHNCRSLVKGPDRATLLMHPTDAQRRGLKTGQRVILRSRTGAVTAPLEVSDSVMAGVVSLPHGFGHAEVASEQKIAGALPGPSANVVTDELRVDRLTGTAVLNAVPVEVTAA